MILEKQLLLPFSLGRVLRKFPNNLKSKILQWEKQKGSSQEIHPKVRSFNAQEIFQNTQTTKGYISEKQMVSKLKVNLLHCIIFKKQSLSLGLENFIWNNNNASGTMSFEWMRPKIFGHKTQEHVWQKTKTISAQMPENVKHSVGGVMIWAFLEATGPALLDLTWIFLLNRNQYINRTCNMSCSFVHLTLYLLNFKTC